MSNTAVPTTSNQDVDWEYGYLSSRSLRTRRRKSLIFWRTWECTVRLHFLSVMLFVKRSVWENGFTREWKNPFWDKRPHGENTYETMVVERHTWGNAQGKGEWMVRPWTRWQDTYSIVKLRIGKAVWKWKLCTLKTWKDHQGEECLFHLAIRF